MKMVTALAEVEEAAIGSLGEAAGDAIGEEAAEAGRMVTEHAEDEEAEAVTRAVTEMVAADDGATDETRLADVGPSTMGVMDTPEYTPRLLAAAAALRFLSARLDADVAADTGMMETAAATSVVAAEATQRSDTPVSASAGRVCMADRLLRYSWTRALAKKSSTAGNAHGCWCGASCLVGDSECDGDDTIELQPDDE